MKLETGKYYLGSDGMKYGPVGDDDDGYFSLQGTDDIWHDDGTGVGNPNLIAECGAQEPTSTSHFTHMLSDLQGIAEKYGYTISNITTNEGPIMVDFKEIAP